MSLNHENGEQAHALAVSALFRQLALFLPQAVFASAKNDVPVWDAATTEAMADHGIQPPKKLSVDSILLGYAAGWAILVEVISKPFADTGRKPDYLRKYLHSPVEILTRNTEQYLGSDAMKRRSMATTANATMLKVDPAKALEAATVELKRRSEEQGKAIMPMWSAALRGALAQSYDENLDDLLEAIVDCDRDPAAEIKGAAKAYINALKEAMLKGKSVTVDTGVFALSTEGETQPA